MWLTFRLAKVFLCDSFILARGDLVNLKKSQ